MQKVTVLLLAGQRPKPGPICEAYKVVYKSLVPVAGQPMILYPLNSLGQS
jgi:dTDP-glucose pyrophosphorylase